MGIIKEIDKQNIVKILSLCTLRTILSKDDTGNQRNGSYKNNLASTLN